MTANELDKQVMDLIPDYDIGAIWPHLELLGDGQKREVRNEIEHSHLYYQWLACLMRLLQPTQVVELGAAAGISTIMMATSLPKDSKLYSVDIDPTAWRWMKHDYPQVVKILGDDLDLAIYPKDCKLEDTGVWFIDSLHTGEHLQKEIDLYKRFWKKGTVLVFDDIRISPDMWEVWENLPYDKRENTNPCHFSGFGVAIV